MTVTPVPHEPGRFLVTSETDGEPWLVDLDDEGVPHCSCQITHNRTEEHATCKHIRHVQTMTATKHPLTPDEREAITMLQTVRFLPVSWDKRFARDVLFPALATGMLGEKSAPQLWRIFIKYRRQTSGPRKAELLRIAEALAAPDFRKTQAAQAAQARIDAEKAKYATATLTTLAKRDFANKLGA